MGLMYKILRPITRVVIRGYYQKVYINGEANIPKDKPVLLAVNHPSSFTEPCVLATHLQRELHFLVRGDVFNEKVKWFFAQTNQLPIYRFRDGFSNMRQNEKQFSYCFDLLENNGCIAVFCEGSTKHIKRTRPIQKGISRIALGALENRSIEDVYIVPVGVNFESSPRARSIVSVQIGAPISVKSYDKQNDEGEERNLIHDLTKEIGAGLRKQMVHIDQDERLALADDILWYAGHDLPLSLFPVCEHQRSSFFDRMQIIGDRISAMSSTDFQELKTQQSKYKTQLKKLGISDKAFTELKNPLGHYLFFFLTLPMILIGGLFLLFIRTISFAIQRKLNNTPEYISGFRMAGFILFTPLLIVVLMLLTLPWLGWYSLTLIVVVPLLMRWSVIGFDILSLLIHKLKFRVLSSVAKSSIREQRTTLLNLIDKRN